MRKRKSSNVSSERQNWEKIFNNLVQMLRNQQNQLQSLANERKFLQDRFQMQHEAWTYDIRMHRDQISEMKGILNFEEKKRLLEAAKAELVLGSKHREASFLKWILEHTEDELADFKAWFECLSYKSSNGEDQGAVFKDTDNKKKGTIDSTNNSIWNNAEEGKCSKDLESELRRLKRECENLALEKSSEVSALLAEKKFVWNQYNIMEKDYANKLRTKQAEVGKANEKIEILVSGMEQLQSANNEKDSTISELKSKVAYMEADTKRLNEEIFRLSVELESLRKSGNNQVTPVLNHCMAGTKTAGSRIVKSNRSRSNAILKKEICTPDAPDPAKVSKRCQGGESGERSLSLFITHDRASALWTCFRATCGWKGSTQAFAGTSSSHRTMNQVTKPKKIREITEAELQLEPLCKEGNRSLRRKASPVITESETPKLFSSNFKVPKVKPSLRNK